MDVGAFIAKYWGKPGGAERATYQMFLTELAQALGAPTPDPATGGELGAYQFEGPVKSEAALGKKGTGRIDLYKRDCFILEAKQSQLKEGESLPDEAPEAPAEPIKDLFGNITGYQTPIGKAVKHYDRLMADARIQAERYSLALPSGHRSPPFLIVADIGRAFELYFDWTGDGRGYGFFPDKQNYRIPLTALASDDKVGHTDLTALQLLAGIWLDPAAIDPRKKAVAVTRDIATRLSRVAEALEKEERERNPGKADFEVSLGIENSSLFLMRVLFCMFAEDVELLPKGSFAQFLKESREKSDQWWRAGLHDLWAKMDQPDKLNRFWSYGDAIVRYFNGNLFSSANVYDLPQEFKGELFEAAKRDWRSVEPAIFGTLLEQVLTDAERSKLGAHYTPRPYVQRLVNATIADVLNPEWHAARDAARAAEVAGDHGAAVQALVDFHNRLSVLRILDPACGTGNFLYVAMELLLQLEGEAIQLAAELGETISPAIHPNQFLGLELNPRAAVIAELVLWIGWLRHRLANHPEAIGDPVLPTLTNINFGTHGGYDAVLRRTPTGEPDVENPMVPDWPEADFIVGNPPFIGGKDIRGSLGSDYAEALWKANPRVPKSADFVMQWWDRAAHTLTAPESPLQRFGFVTTNSITQTFSRRVIEHYLSSPAAAEEAAADDSRLSLVLAIADHPWTKATKDAAAVRIAMTVARRGEGEGRLVEIVGESGLDTDNPVLDERAEFGHINADISVGSDVTSLPRLKANRAMAHKGYQLNGDGFVVSKSIAAALKADAKIAKRYYIGSDLNTRDRQLLALDLYPRTEKEARRDYPEVYQYLMENVRPDRASNPIDYRRENWWLFGQPSVEIREALEDLARAIATPRQGKWRIFTFVEAGSIIESTNVAIASDDAAVLGILQSRIHEEFSLAAGGWMGVGNDPRYFHTQTFLPFPFPDATPEQRATIAELAEELDATRKAALAEVPGLTMTEIYNLREKLRSGAPMNVAEEDRARAARAGIVNRLHEQIDEAVAAAYGWPADLPPSEIVARLVALNAELAAEEKAGHIRWLRPDYQIPRFGTKKD
jgi:type I restriction-modification system DNA methylase subunit